MSTDANTLLAQAKCYTCLGITIAEALQLALLAQIATTGAAGNAPLSTADADPNAAGLKPSNTQAGQWFYQDPAVNPALNTWLWSVSTQKWVQYSV